MFQNDVTKFIWWLEYCVADSEAYIVIKYNYENMRSESTERKQEQFNPKANTKSN